jgi:ABC-type branched-subunit amino acid transport system permease subunit
MSFLLVSLALALVYALAALAAKWLIESLGLLSLAHGSVMLCSAYGFSLLCGFGISPFLSAALGIGIATILGIILGCASRRVISQDFALFSFAVQMAVIFTALVAPGPLRGALGLAGVPAIPGAGWLGRSGIVVAVGTGVLAVTTIALEKVRGSWFAAACQVASRSDELATTLRLKPGLLRLQVGAGYGVVIGFSGVLMAALISFVSPRGFDIGVSISVLAICLIGMRIKGDVLVGSLLVIALPELLRLTALGAGRAGYVQMAIAGAVLFFVILATGNRNTTRERARARR